MPIPAYTGAREYVDGAIVRPSFVLPVNGSDVWFSSLDALGKNAALLRRRLQEDLAQLRRPSLPGLLGIHLQGTALDAPAAQMLVESLCGLGRPLSRVAFIGLDRKAARLVKSLLKTNKPGFSTNFFADFEKAKNWLTGRA